MKTLMICLLFVAILPLCSMADYMGIVDRSASRDSLCFPIFWLDSLGDVQTAAGNDSLWIVVWSPGGTMLYRDSMLYSDARIQTQTYSTRTHYALMDQVTDIDASSTAEGVFGVEIVTKDETGSGWENPQKFSFQIVDRTLDAAFDTLAAVAVDVDGLGGWNPSSDSVNVDVSAAQAGLLRNGADSVWGHADSAWAANTMGSKLRDSTQDDLNAIRDSVQFLVTATGFSTFDNTTDSVIVDVSSAQAGLLRNGADSVWGHVDSAWAANTPGNDLQTARDSVSNLGNEVANLDNWNPILDGDSLIVDQSSLEDMTVATVTDVNDLFIATKADITGATPTTIGFSSSALTQADDYWNDNIVVFFDGSADGQSARIRDFTATTDSVTFGPPLSVAPTQGDSFYVLSLPGTHVDNQAISALSITSDKFGVNAITSTVIQASAIGADQIANTAISEILDSLFTRPATDTATNDYMAEVLREAAGVDLDNITGTLDNAEIGDSLISVAKIKHNSITGGVLDANCIGDSEMGTGAISADVLATDAVSEIMDYMWMGAKDAITGATPGTGGFSSSALTQADDYWNDNMVMFLSGNAADQVARIDDFVAATDSIALSPALTTAPAQNDSFIIINMLQTTAAASLTEADMAEIADSVWHADFELHDGTAGSMADSAQGWGATSASALDSTVVSNIVGRKVWGIAAGVGADSSSLSQRNVDLEMILDGAQSAIDLKDFADAGYDPAGDTVHTNIASGSGLDSATTSRIIGRKVLGIAAGAAGSTDSSTLAQRKVFADTLDDDAITAASIETAAIHTTAIAPNAIDASQIATGAFTASKFEGGYYNEVGEQAADSVWGHADSAYVANSFGSQIRDSAKADLNAIRDTLQFLITATGFSTFDNTTDSVIVDVSSAQAGLIRNSADSVWGAADTAWAANTMGSKLRDSTKDDLNAIRDTAQFLVTATGFSTFDNTTDSVLVDVSAAASALIPDISDSTWNHVDTAWRATSIADSILNGVEDANVTKISGDAPAANNLETMLDGTGGQTLSLGQLAINAASGQAVDIDAVNDNAVDILTSSAGAHSAIEATTWGSNAAISIQNAGTGDGIDFTVSAGDDLEDSTRWEIAAVAGDSVWAKDTTLSVPVTSYGAALKDTIHYQGGAGSITVPAIVAGIWGQDADSAWAAGSMGDSSLNWGRASTAGSGSNTVVYYAIDTSGTDEAVAGVELTVKTIAGATDAVNKTGTGGFFTFSMPTGSLTVIADRPDYIFELDTLNVTGNSTDSIFGYDVPLPTPSDPDAANVVIDVTRLTGTTDILGICMTGFRHAGPYQYAVDTSGGPTVILPLEESACTDTSGRISLTVIKSTEVADTTQGFYTFQIFKGKRMLFDIKDVWVTGTFNLGDSLAGR